jgi:hypothetical protein
LFGFPLFLSLDFPNPFENPENPNKKSAFLLLGFHKLIFVFSGFLFGFRRFSLDLTGFEFFGATMSGILFV